MWTRSSCNARVLNDLKRLGYCFLRELIPTGEAALLASALDHMLKVDDEVNGADHLMEMRERGALRNLAAADPAFESLLEMSPAHEIVDLVLGPTAILNCFDALAIFPGGGRHPWDYHTDLMDLNGVTFPDGMVPGVTLLYYFDRVREQNGATRVIPGSHRWAMAEADPPDVMAERSVPLEVGPGDCVVLDARVWHCAGNNDSGETRTLVKSLFTRPWFRPQMDFTRSVPAERLAALGPRARRYLNLGNVPPTSIDELRWRLCSGDAGPS